MTGRLQAPSGQARSSCQWDERKSGCGPYDRFDAVVLLSAPVDLILDRVANRANPFGATAEDRAKIANDLATFEPLQREGADREIVTTAPVLEVVAALEQVARAAGHRDPLASRRAHRS